MATKMTNARNTLAAALLAATALSACAVGPNYSRPAAAPSAAFKEAQGWTPANPIDHIDRGAWWSVFNDPTLDGLMKRVAIDNQNIAVREAAYRQARAVSAEARAAFFPTVNATASRQTSERSGGGSQVVNGVVVQRSGPITVYNAGLNASWVPDIWGRIRRQNEGAKAGYQASAADLAAATLSFQTDLAVNYFSLRAVDEQKRLLDASIQSFQQAVTLSTNQYNAGVVARSDVITAETQLRNAQAQATNLGVQRAQLEHAIATLVGVAPSELSIAEAPLTRTVPVAPAGLPSTLLERRPDIASAERQAQAASAQIGVQTAAWFPNLTLSGSYGYNSTELSNLFSASSNLWSYGPALAFQVLDFGARNARIRQARAVYDQRVATYRQTVLTAFQSVEDQLAALRVLEEEAQIRAETEASARQAEALALNRYRAGQTDITAVVQAQTVSVNAQQAALTALRQRLIASVSLIEALGGGWTNAELPG
jgi:NodT family efflux transporter outer membrane factor (OMF) lipoprotein